MIEQAYKVGESLGLSVWTQDEAGPFQTIPYEGYAWRSEGNPNRQPHEYVRNGTAKLLTLFHPSDGQVRAKGVTSCTNAVLHPWLQQELGDILSDLPTPSEDLDSKTNRALWECWRAGLDTPPPLPDDLPPLRILLIWDNLKGHKTSSFVDWLIQHGIMPLYTPLGGFLVKHDRVDTANLETACVGRTASLYAGRDYHLAGSSCSCLEPESDPFRVGRKTSCTSGTEPPATPCAGWLWSLHSPSDTTLSPHHN